jgi:hypothetical protein
MNIIRSTHRSGKRRSAHGEPVEPLERSVAVELLERLERLDPGWTASCLRSSLLREPHSAGSAPISEAGLKVAGFLAFPLQAQELLLYCIKMLHYAA